jgi:autotransporter-associated beta strand protein
MGKAFLTIIVAIAAALPVPAAAQLTWGAGGNGGDGTWNSTNTNWYNGTSNVAWVSGDTATFPGIFNPSTKLSFVTVSGTQVVSQLVFSPNLTSTFGEYLISGGTLQGTSTGLTITMVNGVATAIGSTIAGGSVTVTGPGYLGLGGANTYTGGLTINSGSGVTVEAGVLGTGGVTDNGVLQYFTTSAPLEEENIITGTGSVQIYGSHTQSMDAQNTYSGDTQIVSFNLYSTISEVNQSTILSSISGTTTIASGPFGTGNIFIRPGGKNTTLEDNGTAIALANSLSLGDSFSSGTITFSSTGNGSLNFDGTSLSTPSTVTLTGSFNLVVNNTTTIADNISGNYSITQSGTGTLILKGTNTNSVGMEVASGTLLANNTFGSATGTGTLTVDSGAKLGGTGFINSTHNTINGTIQGGAPGATTTGSLTLTSSGTTTFGNMANLVFNLAAAGGNNKLNVSNSAVLFSGSNLTLNLLDSSTTDYANGLQFVLITADGDANQFSGITVDGSNHISGLNLTLVGTATNGQQDSLYYANSYLFMNNGNIAFEIEAGPEPSTWILLLGGLASLTFWKTRRIFLRTNKK